MVARVQQNKNEVELGRYADLLLSYALLAEGSDLPDAVRFNQLVAELMIQTLSNDAQSDDLSEWKTRNVKRTQGHHIRTVLTVENEQ